ncbi:MAG: hypothetical protein FJ171_10675 [Gammaproteobacteria bacterium]|nr:hypothetical protein [Gammaproteobacteria bacterium]
MSARLLALSFLLLTSACVSQGPESLLGTEERALQERRIELTRTGDCVFQSGIDGFDTLDDRHVVLYSGGRRRAYLAELTGVCFDLGGQVSLTAVDGDGNGQICGYGRDSLAFQRMGRVENCRILGLEQLSDERRLELGLAIPARPEPGKEPKAGDTATPQ